MPSSPVPKPDRVCEETRDALRRRAAGRGAPPEDRLAALRAHLEDCAECRAERDALGRETSRFGRAFLERLRARGARESVGPRERPRRWLVPFLLACAGLFVLARSGWIGAPKARVQAESGPVWVQGLELEPGRANLPLAPGWSLETGSGGAALVRFGAATVRLGSEGRLKRLPAHGEFVLRLTAGEVELAGPAVLLVAAGRLELRAGRLRARSEGGDTEFLLEAGQARWHSATQAFDLPVGRTARAAVGEPLVMEAR